MLTLDPMKKAYYALLGLIVILGMGSIFYYGLKPRPVLKIKVSEIESPTVLGNAILLRLREEILKAPMLMLGVSFHQKENIPYISEFVRLMNLGDLKVSEVLIDQNLPTEWQIPEAIIFPLKSEYSQIFSERLKRPLVMTFVEHASALVKTQLAAQLKRDGKVFTSLHFLSIPGSRDQEKDFEYQCKSEDEGLFPRAQLDCFILSSARANYLKMKPGKTFALVNQIGLTEYLVLIKHP